MEHRCRQRQQLLLLLQLAATLTRCVAVTCYSCTGFSGDNRCGTPFNEVGQTTCEGQHCSVYRISYDRRRLTSSTKLSSCGSWLPVEDTSYSGGQSNDASNLNSCMTSCFQTTSCTGVDWDAKATDAGKNCRLHHDRLGQVDRLQSPGVTHFDLTRSDECPPCVPQWTSITSMQYGGGSPDGSMTLQACQSACLKTAKCVGVDWNPGQRPGKRCWLQEQSVYYGIYAVSKSLSHYDLTRTSLCEGGYEQVVRGCAQVNAAPAPTAASCRRMRGVQSGIACTCSTDRCNGNDDEMTTDEYINSFGRDQLQQQPSQLRSAYAFKAAKAAAAAAKSAKTKPFGGSLDSIWETSGKDGRGSRERRIYEDGGGDRDRFGEDRVSRGFFEVHWIKSDFKPARVNGGVFFVTVTTSVLLTPAYRFIIKTIAT